MVPITKREKAKTAASSGEENDENNSAREQIIRNCRTIKYRATRISASGPRELMRDIEEGGEHSDSHKKVFTTRVPREVRRICRQ